MIFCAAPGALKRKQLKMKSKREREVRFGFSVLYMVDTWFDDSFLNRNHCCFDVFELRF